MYANEFETKGKQKLTASERVGWGTFRLLKAGERTLKPLD